ncbi:MAG: S8 family serine peptidase [Syntrophobacterales bacterium]|nr:MAG: S8 family serine peptidase [Syntrophobacterales bacterium]
MRKYFIAAILLSFILAHAGNGISRVWVDKGKLPQYAPGEILVKFKKDTSKADIAQLNTRLGSKSIKTFPSIGVRRIKIKPGETVAEAVNKYSSDPSVEYAEPNYILHTFQTFPNDPSFGLLWGLDYIQDADIDAPEAWDITTGSANIVIAVIDTGVNYNHTDLAANMWTNPGEDPWAVPTDPATGNGIDDDGNGYIDDWRGWDFLGHKDPILSPDDNTPDNDPMDQSDHGTHVAGTIAAVGDNANGIAGVMWTARIMPLRFLNGQGGTDADAIEAINYAAMMGAHIINASWGGYGYSQALYDAIANSGVLFVAAAANDANDNDGDFKAYPASYDLPNIISVAATDQIDVLADFSNYGATSVDVGAPGVNIYSSILARNPVFFDDMESGDANFAHDAMNPILDTWALTVTGPPPPEYYGPPYSFSGIWSFTDSPYDPVEDDWNYEPDTDSWLGLFSAIDPVGQFGAKLTFWARSDLGPT